MKKNILLACIISIFYGCSSDKFETDLKIIAVKSGDYWGYIDQKGAYKINPQFKYAHAFSEGKALVKSSNDGIVMSLNAKGGLLQAKRTLHPYVMHTAIRLSTPSCYHIVATYLPYLLMASLGLLLLFPLFRQWKYDPAHRALLPVTN